ncbi:MAG: hypothetical protein HFJ05_04570 [Eubacterium sp.]|nr:hypothetical protein [Eubacterium sp.]
MLRSAGIFFILAGAYGFGSYLCLYLKKRLDQLVECREIFAQMDACREYLRLPYAELLKKSADGKSKILTELLKEVADEMEKKQNPNVQALWEAAFAKRKKQLFIGEEETELLLALARSLMLEGNHTQVSKVYFMQLEDKIQRAMEEKKEKQKLYRAISVLGGLFLVVLLL